MPSAHAGLIYQILFDQPSYEIAQGESLDVGILFREIHERGSVDIPKLDSTNGRNGDGIFSPGFVLDFSGMATDSGLGVLFDQTDFALNTPLLSQAFTTIEFDAASSLLTVIANAESFEGVEVAPKADGSNDIYEFEIGRLEVTNLGGLGDIRTLTLSQPATPFTNDFADFSGTPSIRFGQATVGVTAVPEPSSLAFMLLVGVSAAVARRMKSRKLSLLS